MRVVRYYHMLERTNAKGPGIKFVGRCVRCGQTGFPASGALLQCKGGLQSPAEAVAQLVTGEAK